MPHPYAVILSSASVMVDGPELVRESMTRETLAEAEHLARRTSEAQPGIVATVAVQAPNGWRILATDEPIRDWLARFV